MVKTYEQVELVCPNCKAAFVKPLWRHLSHIKRGDKNHFCSRKCSNSGRFNPQYKRGNTVNNGYIRLTLGKNKGKYLHVVIMEKLIGRELKDGEQVHHLDGNRRNNNKDNLELCTSQSDHMNKFHSEEGRRGFK